MKIFPVPSKFNFSEECRNLSSLNWITLPNNAGFPLKQRIMEIAKELTLRFTRKPHVCMGMPESGNILVSMERKTGFPAEGYQLSLKTTGPIRIQASDDAGFFYGMQTAFQLLALPAEVPCCEIKDSPSIRERGYMLDISRNKIPTMETMKEMVRSLAKLRYNSLQLYIEHSFAFSAHERVWAGYTPFTSEEIMELDAFCKDYFIELVPNLNSFGHLERWLKYAEYKSLAECERPYYWEAIDRYMQGVLHPSKESLDFMDSLYTEFLPNFTSKKLNIGCDETWELGKGRSAEICKKKGTTQVYLDFLTKLAKTASKHGFSVEFWGDIIMHNPELICKLPKGITALEWGYEATHPFEKDTLAFKKSGIDFIVCPGTSSWNTILGRIKNMIGNLTNAMFYGCKNGAKGILMTDWGDNGHHQYYPVSWPGITMGGGCAWNATAKDTETLLSYGISMAFAPGDDGIRLGEFLLEMGRVNEDFEKTFGNCTPFGCVMTAYRNQRKSAKSFLTQVRSSDVAKAQKHIQALLDVLTDAPFAVCPLINRELENSLRMAMGANAFLGKAVGGRWNRPQWLDNMRHVTAEHEHLWLARNRSGGLWESSQYLRKFMEYDPLEWKKR